ncbi:MAG: hypothetical protein R3Y07_08750 [Eubacteriales bacterium]
MKKTTIIASSLILVSIAVMVFLRTQYSQNKAEIYAQGEISYFYRQEPSDEFNKTFKNPGGLARITFAHSALVIQEILPEDQRNPYQKYRGTPEEMTYIDAYIEVSHAYEFSDEVDDLATELMNGYLPLAKFSVTGGEKQKGLIKNEETQFVGYQGVALLEIHPIDPLHSISRDTLDALWETHTAEQGVSPETRNSYLVEVLELLLADPEIPPYLPPIMEEIPVMYHMIYGDYYLYQIDPTYQRYDLSYTLTPLVFAFDGK